MRIVVTHLTRMQLPYVCVAGIDLDTGTHVRPVLDSGRLDRSLLVRRGGPFDIGAVVDLGSTWYAGHAPETEDHRFSRHRAVRQRTMASGDFWRLLERTAQRRLVDIFGHDLYRSGAGYAVDIGGGHASLGSLHPARVHSLTLDSFGKLRIAFIDGEETASLSVTDLRLYEDDHSTLKRETIQRLAQQIARGADMILTVGLGRAWQKPGDTVAHHWLQVNNIYSVHNPMWQDGSAMLSTSTSQAGGTAPTPKSAPIAASQGIALSGASARDRPTSGSVNGAGRVSSMPTDDATLEGKGLLDQVGPDAGPRLPPVLPTKRGPITPSERTASSTTHDEDDQGGHLAATRLQHPQASTSWTQQDDTLLVAAWAGGITVARLAHQLERQPSAISARLRKLGLTV